MGHEQAGVFYPAFGGIKLSRPGTAGVRPELSQVSDEL